MADEDERRHEGKELDALRRAKKRAYLSNSQMRRISCQRGEPVPEKCEGCWMIDCRCQEKA